MKRDSQVFFSKLNIVFSINSNKTDLLLSTKESITSIKQIFCLVLRVNDFYKEHHLMIVTLVAIHSTVQRKINNLIC